MAMDPDAKDFLLHLYDKLWENMGAKEGRLWSYLSVYGAAIALSLGVGQYAGIELYAVTIVLALTVWALLIVINANWWYERNRLMVTQIERKFVVTGAVDGVIPKSYQDATFGIDRLYRGSVLILSAIASMLYLKLMWEHGGSRGLASVDVVFSVGLLYSLFLMSTMYCVNQNESYISKFYSIKKLLLGEAGGMTPAEIEKNVDAGLKEAYSSCSWIIPGLLFLMFGMGTFDVFPGRSNMHGNCPGILGIVLQIALIGIYVIVSRPSSQRDRWWRRTWLVQIVCAGIIVASAGIFLAIPYRSSQAATATVPFRDSIPK